MIIFNKVFFFFISSCKNIFCFEYFPFVLSRFSVILHVFYPLDYLGKIVVWRYLIFILSNTLWLLGNTTHHFVVLYGNYRLIREVHFPQGYDEKRKLFCANSFVLAHSSAKKFYNKQLTLKSSTELYCMTKCDVI